MKKVSLFALLVLAGLLFAAPALRAQEAEETEAQKKAKAIKLFVNDEDLYKFLESLDPEALAAYVAAAVESGDAALIDRVSNALNNLGTDIATAIAGGQQQTDTPDAGSSKADAAATAISSGFADAAGMLDGDDFDTNSQAVTTSHAGEEEEEEPWPVPPVSRRASRY